MIRKVGSGLSLLSDLAFEELDCPVAEVGALGPAAGADVWCAETKMVERKIALTRTGVNGFILPYVLQSPFVL